MHRTFVVCGLLGLISFASSSVLPSCVENGSRDTCVGKGRESTATFALYDNGASTGGKEVTLTMGDFEEMTKNKGLPEESSIAFAARMSDKIRVSKFDAPEPVVADRAYREDGELITSFTQLLPEDYDEDPRRVYLVAEDLEFVWPFVELHHRQNVSPRVLQSPYDNATVVVESLSEKPRVFRVHHMFTMDEAQGIIDNALNLEGSEGLKRSTTGNDEKLNAKDTGRTSENVWDHSSPAAVAMIERSFNLTTIPQDDGKRDGLQVVRYLAGQGYNTHPDYFTNGDDAGKDEHERFEFLPYKGGSNRFATVFMYLNNVQDGGFTVFPKAEPIVPQREPVGIDFFPEESWEHRVLWKCYNKLAVPAVAGTAALFYSVTPDGQIDASSHHAACPLTEGMVKWGANIWIWNKHRFGDIRTGQPRKFKLLNLTTQQVYVTWEGRPNGEVPAGRNNHYNSYEFHRFKAYFGGHNEGKVISYYTCGEDNGTWEIKPPREIQTIISNTNNQQQEQERLRALHTTSVELQVHNHLGQEVTLFFNDEHFGMIPPHQAYMLSTFVGHTFVAAIKKDSGSNEYETIDDYTVAEDMVVNNDSYLTWNVALQSR